MQKLALLFALLLLIACSGREQFPVPDNVIARIDSQEVLRKEFVLYLQANYADILESKDEEILNRLFDSYLEQRVLLNYLQIQHQLPGEKEISEYLELSGKMPLLNTYNLHEKRILALNTSLILAEEKLKNMVTEETPLVTTDEARDYYEQNINEFLKGKSYCFLRFSSSYEDLLKDARYWLVSRKKGLEFFRKRYHDIQIEENCFQASEIPDPFLKALEKLKPGRVSRIIQTNLGASVSYNLLKLKENIAPRKLPFEEVEDSIREKLSEQHLNEYVAGKKQEMLQQSRIVVYPERILVFNYSGKFLVFHGEEE
ncbi:MAG: peptidyl-prolyl cis-trans isomerase [Holophagae bacterium]|nr:peptidyl-prolyl cis-trans isomerase [Holophagae bacterium]